MLFVLPNVRDFSSLPNNLNLFIVTSRFPYYKLQYIRLHSLYLLSVLSYFPISKVTNTSSTALAIVYSSESHDPQTN